MRGLLDIDLRWSSSGDFCISQIGDLEDTSSTKLGSFLQEVQTRIRSDLYDWALQPQIGSGLSEIVGEPNNKETAESGKAMIIASLTKDGFVENERIRVRYMPISRHTIFYNVLISLPGISETDILNLSLLFTTNDFEIVFM